MNKNMALTREQFQSLIDKGLTVEDIVASEKKRKESGGLSKLFTNIGSKLSGRGQDIAEAAKEAISGDLASTAIGTRQRLKLRVGGAIAGGINDIIFEGLKAITPDKFEQKIQTGIEKVAQTDIAQNISSRISSWAEKNPKAAKDLENAIDLASLLPTGKGLQIGTKAAATTARVAGQKAATTAGKGLQVAGTLAEKGGKTIVSAALPPTEQAGKILAYKAKTPLMSRFKQAVAGVEKAPITPADVAIKYNLATLTRSGIGIKAKRIANDLFENQVKPVLNGIKEKVSKKELFDSVKKEIMKTEDISRRKSLLNAFDSIADDYKNVSNWNYATLDKIKSDMANRLPSKVWLGQEIAGDANNVRKLLSDKARNIIRKKLPTNIVEIYDDYGALKGLMTMGEKALKSGINTNMIGLAGEAMRVVTTPLTTITGTAISKVGSAAKKVGKKLLK